MVIRNYYNFTAAVEKRKKREMKTENEPEGHATNHELDARVNE